MILIDVNVLIYAHRSDSPDHDRYREWLENVIADEKYGVSDVILSSFLRIVTKGRVYREPTPLESAIAFLEGFRSGQGAFSITITAGVWERFVAICRAANVSGNLVPDAFLAAIAVESGCEWITTDRDFNRFSGVSFRHPLRKST